jgi:ketosteroid isomerase-like protein
MANDERTSSGMSNDEVVDGFFTALVAGDTDALRDIYAPNATIWHNTGGVAENFSEQSVEDNIAMNGVIAELLAGHRFDHIRRGHVDGGVYQMTILRGELAGQPVEHYMAIWFQIDDGHITRIEEYFDSATAAPVVTAVMAALASP